MLNKIAKNLGEFLIFQIIVHLIDAQQRLHNASNFFRESWKESDKLNKKWFDEMFKVHLTRSSPAPALEPSMGFS